MKNTKITSATSCRKCTARLVAIAETHCFWFRVIHKFMSCGIRTMAWLHQIKPETQDAYPSCYNCIRFIKNRLKEESSLFMWLNDRIDPYFDLVLSQVVSHYEPGNHEKYSSMSQSCDPDGQFPQTDGKHSSEAVISVSESQLNAIKLSIPTKNYLHRT